MDLGDTLLNRLAEIVQDTGLKMTLRLEAASALFRRENELSMLESDPTESFKVTSQAALCAHVERAGFQAGSDVEAASVEKLVKRARRGRGASKIRA